MNCYIYYYYMNCYIYYYGTTTSTTATTTSTRVRRMEIGVAWAAQEIGSVERKSGTVREEDRGKLFQDLKLRPFPNEMYLIMAKNHNWKTTVRKKKKERKKEKPKFTQKLTLSLIRIPCFPEHERAR